MKSHYLPSLEVKVHPPDEFQPKVQAFIAAAEAKRETAERKLMQTLEKDYNDELNKCAADISKTIQTALEVFKDPDLLSKSAEYAVNPPTIMITKPDPNANHASFKEIADFSMNNIQQDTMTALVEDDNKLEKFRNAQIDISLGDGLEKKDNKNSKNETKEKNGNMNNNKNEVKKRLSSNNETKNNEDKNGPVDPLDMELTPEMINSFSFLELKGDDGKFAKPISVIMKLPAEPDTKIKQEIETVESAREKQEKKIFAKAKKEFELISQITKKELQLNLSHELIPFFVVSKNEIKSLKAIIEKNFPKGKGGSSRFLQIDQSELDNKFKDHNLNISQNKKSLIDFNKYTYNKILGLFSGAGGDHDYTTKNEDNYSNVNTNPNMYNIPTDGNLLDIKNKYKMKLNEGKSLSNFNVNYSEDKDQNLEQETNNKISMIKKENSNDKNKDSTNKDDSENSLDNVSFNYDSCMDMQKKFTDLDLDCQKLKEDYKEVSSFLELRSKSNSESMIKNKLKSNLRNSGRLLEKGQNKNKMKEGEEDFINVKFSAAEETYPTIEKLVAQMMTRRDLSEKFERLKILEFETNLQKAENEMIQDILHDELYKIMANFKCNLIRNRYIN